MTDIMVSVKTTKDKQSVSNKNISIFVSNLITSVLVRVLHRI